MCCRKILLAVLLVALVRVALGRADPTPQPSTVSAPAKPTKSGAQTFTFRGWGETEEETLERALENARRFLNHYGQPPGPDHSWGLSLEEVRAQFVTQREEQPGRDVNGKWLKCWAVTITITPAQLEELRRQARSHERLVLSAQGVPLVVLVVAAVGGLLRLREWWQCGRGGCYNQTVAHKP